MPTRKKRQSQEDQSEDEDSTEKGNQSKYSSAKKLKVPEASLFQHGQKRQGFLSDVSYDETRKYDERWKLATLKHDIDLNGYPTHPEEWGAENAQDIEELRMPVPTQREINRLYRGFVGAHDEAIIAKRDKPMIPEPERYRTKRFQKEFPKEIKAIRKKGKDGYKALQKVYAIEKETNIRLRDIRAQRFAYNQALIEQERMHGEMHRLVYEVVQAIDTRESGQCCKEMVIQKFQELLPTASKDMIQRPPDQWGGEYTETLTKFDELHLEELEMVTMHKQLWTINQVKTIKDWAEAKEELLLHPTTAAKYLDPQDGSSPAIPESDMIKSQLAAERTATLRNSFTRPLNLKTPGRGRARGRNGRGRGRFNGRGGNPRSGYKQRENYRSDHQAQDRSEEQGSERYQGKQFESHHKWHSPNQADSQKDHKDQPSKEGKQNRPPIQSRLKPRK